MKKWCSVFPNRKTDILICIFQHLSKQHYKNVLAAIIASGSAANYAFNASKPQILQKIPEFVDDTFKHAFMHAEEEDIPPLHFKMSSNFMNMNELSQKFDAAGHNIFSCLGTFVINGKEYHAMVPNNGTAYEDMLKNDISPTKKVNADLTVFCQTNFEEKQRQSIGKYNSGNANAH